MNPVRYFKVPQKVAQNEIFSTFCVAFHIVVAGKSSHFKFGMWIEHSQSQPMDDKPSLKWAWPRHVTHFKFLVPLRYLWNCLSRDFKIGVHVDHSKSQPTDDKLSLKGAWLLSCGLFNFWEISSDISKTVRDSLRVSIYLNRKSYALY